MLRPSLFAKDDDMRKIWTFGGDLRQLMFRAEAYCAKGGDDLDQWEELFAPGAAAVEIAFHRPADVAAVTLAFADGDKLRLVYSCANRCAWSDPGAAALDWSDKALSPSAFAQAGQAQLAAQIVRALILIAYARSALKPVSRSGF